MFARELNFQTPLKPELLYDGLLAAGGILMDNSI